MAIGVIFLTVRFSFVGNAVSSSGQNIEIQTNGATKGFVLNNDSQSDDGNSGFLSNYQCIDFIFEHPVDFTFFLLADIDSASSGDHSISIANVSIEVQELAAVPFEFSSGMVLLLAGEGLLGLRKMSKKSQIELDK